MLQKWNEKKKKRVALKRRIISASGMHFSIVLSLIENEKETKRCTIVVSTIRI